MKVLHLSLAGLLTILPVHAGAQAIIDNGVIQLGVDVFGQLNVPGGAPSPVTGTSEVGLRFLPTGNEATSHGCLCEGWGVGIADASGDRIASGSANNDRGVFNLAAVSFSSTASTATSVVDLLADDGVTSLLRVTHTFGPAAETSNLYRVNVSVENISGMVVPDLRYTRTFDWDVEPDTFSEVVTHAGVASTPAVLLAIDNGFVDSDPFSFDRSNLIGGSGDFVDIGPDDIGSNFDFGFGGLAAGETFEFDIFYGAGATELDVIAALGAVQAEVASLGQPASDPDGLGLDGLTNTFVFGFSGVGGEIIFPDPNPGGTVVPLPATAWLLLGALGMLGGSRVSRRRSA